MWRLPAAAEPAQRQLFIAWPSAPYGTARQDQPEGKIATDQVC
jgi:hypothetical protein